MGNEFYLIKPNKQEKFYLGKHVQPLSCINVSADTADYIDCDCFSDFLMDFLDSNPDGLVGYERTLGDIQDFAYELYEWCDNKVYFSNDCCDDFELWKDYKETGSVITFCEKHPCYKALLEEFIEQLPPHKVYKFKEGEVDFERTLGRVLDGTF